MMLSAKLSYIIYIPKDIADSLKGKQNAYLSEYCPMGPNS